MLSAPQLRQRLLDLASQPYRAAGRFAWHFARGKLDGDPVFVALLGHGLLPPRVRVLDLGCGQALLAAWLRAAQQAHADGLWCADWPPPPHDWRYHGIELMQDEVRRAQTAFGAGADAPLAARAQVMAGDIRSAEFPASDAVILLDVLHYLERDAQVAVLRRVRAALSPAGCLLLRIGDADGGLRFRISNWVDLAVLWARGHGRARLHCRPLSDWLALLAELGFDTTAMPMSHNTPFANVLLVARAR